MKSNLIIKFKEGHNNNRLMNYNFPAKEWQYIVLSTDRTGYVFQPHVCWIILPADICSNYDWFAWGKWFLYKSQRWDCLLHVICHINPNPVVLLVLDLLDRNTDAVFSCARNSNTLLLWQDIWNVIYILAFCQSLVSVWFQLPEVSLYWKRSEKPTGHNPILCNMSVLTGYILLLELFIQVLLC